MLPLLTCVSGVLDRGHHGHFSSTRTHGLGATYLDGYGDGPEGNDDGEIRRLDLAISELSLVAFTR